MAARRMNPIVRSCELPARPLPQSMVLLPSLPLASSCGFVAAVGKAHEVYDYAVSRILSEFVDPDPADRSAVLDVVLREQPEEDEDEDEEEDDQDGEDDGNSDGYSE